uniref:C-type lectin domain-containing protein n=1 Tax=Cyprinus carpio carpio TaxID=630221 RepID=A0A9J7YZT6_CYPCA
MLAVLKSSGKLTCCEEGWRPYEERCYFFSSDMKSWHDALEDCVSKGSNLMSIQDIHEQVRHTPPHTSIFWIGLNDVASEGNWEWSDGTVFYPYLS